MDQRWARPFFALTAACVVAGIVIQLFVTANNDASFGGSALGRALNIFAFFTILSNLLVGGTCLLLAIDLDRHSSVFAAFRLTAVVSITLTFLVFHVVLSRLLDLDSSAQVANQLQHTVVPILTIVGWVAFGPRGLTSSRTVKLTVIFPLAYMAFTMIRGPLASDFYPYPFTNVKDLGYARVAVNGLWIGLLFIALAAGAHALDQRLGPRASPDETRRTP